MRFEEALQRLEEIVTAMERGEVGIEESIAQYEEATRLAQLCRQVLDRAEQQIKLIRENAQGGVTLVDFEPGASETGAQGDPPGPPRQVDARPPQSN